MSKRKLKRIAALTSLQMKLTRHGLTTCGDVLSYSDIELMFSLDMDLYSVKDLLDTVSRVIVPIDVTALDIAAAAAAAATNNALPCRFLPTTLHALDTSLLGGLPSGTITEIVGPSGCGKTQLCLSLSVLCTMPRSYGGLDGSVVYIDTEGSFSAERLVEIARNRFPEFFCSKGKRETPSSLEALARLTTRVHIFRESTSIGVLNVLKNLEAHIIETGSLLIILDSVAAPVRKEFDKGSMGVRSNVLSQQAAILKTLADVFSIPVVVTNQVTTAFRTPNRNFSVKNGDFHDSDKALSEPRVLGNEHGDSESYVTAALGITWAHSVNTRLIVEYVHSQQRSIKVVKSPVSPCVSFRYIITSAGLRLVNSDMGSSDTICDTEMNQTATSAISVRTVGLT